MALKTNQAKNFEDLLFLAEALRNRFRRTHLAITHFQETEKSRMRVLSADALENSKWFRLAQRLRSGYDSLEYGVFRKIILEEEMSSSSSTSRKEEEHEPQKPFGKCMLDLLRVIQPLEWVDARNAKLRQLDQELPSA